MESATLGVVLDSSVVVEAERQRLNLASFLRVVSSYAGTREVALCAVTVAELAHGIHRANTFERRKLRRDFLDALKKTVPIYAVTVETAELVGKLGAESAKKGMTIPFDDLLIGACAVELGYAIATHNRRHFEMIPGLDLILV